MTATALHRLQTLVAALRTVRIAADAAGRLPARIDCVAVVGSTCAGKTTIIDAIRSSALVRDGRVAVPVRYVTRPRRLNDDAAENRHVSADEFARLTATGAIALHWRRPMEGSRELRYGFPPIARGPLPIYSGNNALCDNAASIRPVGALAGALLLGVHAPDDERERRLRSRSPDLVSHRAAEVSLRLADASALAASRAHLVLDNHGELAAIAPTEAVELVGRLVAAIAQR